MLGHNLVAPTKTKKKKHLKKKVVSASCRACDLIELWINAAALKSLLCRVVTSIESNAQSSTGSPPSSLPVMKLPPEVWTE